MNIHIGNEIRIYSFWKLLNWTYKMAVVTGEGGLNLTNIYHITISKNIVIEENQDRILLILIERNRIS